MNKGKGRGFINIYDMSALYLSSLVWRSNAVLLLKFEKKRTLPKPKNNRRTRNYHGKAGVLMFVLIFSFSSTYSSSITQSQKKRLLAKAQNEFVIPATTHNGSVVTKQEPSNVTSELQYCSGGSSCKDLYHCVAPPQEQHIVYAT